MACLASHALTLLHFVLTLLPSVISSRIYATIFALSVGLNITLSGPIHSTTVKLTSKKHPTGVYSQQILSRRSDRSRTVVIIHGVAITAHEDPRIVTLAQAFAAAQPDTIVVVPYIPQLAEVRLKEGTVAEIRDVLEAVTSNRELTPTGTISVASPCISGGFSIVAATYLTTVESLFLIGPHADVENALLHALDRKGNDDSRYGINSVLSSFYYPPNEPLSQMLKAYCTDDHKRNLNIPSDELQPLLEQYPDAAEEYHRLHNDGEFLSDKLRQIYDVHRQIFEGMSPILRLKYLDASSVTLVHSQSDEIVPPNESLVLYNALKDRKEMSVAYLITPLLNHGDQTTLGLKDVPAILKLIDTFSNFFRSVSRSSNAPSEKKRS